MTTIAIPALDAERLAELQAWLCVKMRMPAEETARSAVAEIAINDAYRIGAAHRSDYARHLDTALSELAIDRVGAVRDGGEWTVTLTARCGNSRNGEAATLIEAMLEAVMRIEEMQSAQALARSNAL